MEKIFCCDILPESEKDMRIEGAKGTNIFLAALDGIFQKKEVVVSNIDESNPGDRVLALQALLRGKTAEEYSSIVHDLLVTADATKDPAESNRLSSLVSDIMSIAELNLGITWGS